MAAVVEVELNVSGCLIRGLAVLQMLQLPSGQMATLQPSEQQGLGQRALAPAALPSAEVHHALAGFDPAIDSVAHGALQAVAPAQRAWFAASVRQVRRRLRGFLRAERQADGSWRRHGRGSGSTADLATTAGASVALAEGSRLASRQRRQFGRLSERFCEDSADRAEALPALAHRLSLAALAADADEVDGLRQQISKHLAQVRARHRVPARTALAVLRAWRLAGLANLELRSCGLQSAAAEDPTQGMPQSAADRAAQAIVASELEAWSRVERLMPSLQGDLFAAPNVHVAEGTSGKATSVAVNYARAMVAVGRWAATSGRCHRHEAGPAVRSAR